MKRKQIRCLLVVLFCIGVLGYNTKIQAESATMTFSTKQIETQKGNEISVTLSVDADKDIGELEGYIYYSSQVLEFKGGGSCVGGGDGVLRLYDSGSENTDPNKKYILKFEAKKVGVSDIYFSEKPLILSLEEGAEFSVSTNRISIQVTAGKNKSGNTKLKSLKISPGTLKPEFEKEVYFYTAKVSAEIKNIVVSAIPEDKEADIIVKGNNKLKSGKNTIILTVEAENGDKKDYTITVTKEEMAVPTKDPQTEDNEDNGEDEINEEPLEEATNNAMDGFQIINQDGRIILKNSYQYEITELDDESLIPEGYIKTKLILYGTDVTAYTKKDNLEDDFLLIYAIDQEGDKTFYQYDRAEKTLQRYSQPIISSQNGNANLLKADKYQEKVNQLSLIIAVLSGTTVLLLIGVIYMFMKSKGYKDDLD